MHDNRGLSHIAIDTLVLQAIKGSIEEDTIGRGWKGQVGRDAIIPREGLCRAAEIRDKLRAPWLLVMFHPGISQNAPATRPLHNPIVQGVKHRVVITMQREQDRRCLDILLSHSTHSVSI
ncbi:hypothetical protein COY28_02510 [Candidatus Woesearchaeota archaeon CG_4_10_14_0_2_um_filter_57_5]|nr:MAG: hypothetical protein COY28_02510 [Candidatus Woesearchaeota archaeon CG_4_10_14_0_2_um_filter_57_5]